MRWKLKLETQENPVAVELRKIDGQTYYFDVDGQEVRIENPRIGPYSLSTADLQLSFESWSSQSWRAVSNGESFSVTPLNEALGAAGSRDEIRTQMPGRVLKILVKPGEKVQARQTLLIIEAMKMENEIRAEGEATIQSIEVSQGQSVESGMLLLKLAS